MTFITVIRGFGAIVFYAHYYLYFWWKMKPNKEKVKEYENKSIENKYKLIKFF